MEELIRRAEEGDAEAQFQLGLVYYHGNGVNQDYRKAYHWFQGAIVQGYGDAQQWMDKMIRIHVWIDNERYPMIVKRTDESQYREVAKLLNDRLNMYRETYSDTGIIKQWAMTAFEFAFEALTYKAKNDTKPYKDKLEELGKELDKYLE